MLPTGNSVNQPTTPRSLQLFLDSFAHEPNAKHPKTPERLSSQNPSPEERTTSPDYVNDIAKQANRNTPAHNVFQSNTQAKHQNQLSVGHGQGPKQSPIHSPVKPKLLKSPGKTASPKIAPSKAESFAKHLSVLSTTTDSNLPNNERQSRETKEESANISVCVRVRQLTASERSSRCNVAVSVANKTELSVDYEGERKYFKVGTVLDETVGQDDVFELIGRPAVDNLFLGYNATILAYGQTSSGKTYTMIGQDLSAAYLQSAQVTHGIIPRALECTFQRYSAQNANEVCSISCSFFEIYNENIADLLDNSGRYLREDTKSGIYVEELKEEEIKSPAQGIEVLLRGLCRRQVASTAMNAASSRSHAIFIVRVQVTATDEFGRVTKRKSVLNLVDLAGSERQKLTDTSGLRLQEAGKINGSLFVLGSVINALCESNTGKQVHVPYRDSKLTFYLKDSLGGNSKTWLIANISPSESCVLESLSTLRFAQRSSEVQNKAKLNVEITSDINSLKNELNKLQAEVSLLREKEMAHKKKTTELETLLHAASETISQHERMTTEEKSVAESRVREDTEELKWKYEVELEQLRFEMERKNLEIQMCKSHLREETDKNEANALLIAQYEHEIERLNQENQTLREAKRKSNGPHSPPKAQRCSLFSCRDSTSSFATHKGDPVGKKTMAVDHFEIGNKTLEVSGIGRLTPIKSVGKDVEYVDVPSSPRTFISKVEETTGNNESLLDQYEQRLAGIRDNFALLLVLLNIPDAQNLVSSSETADDFFHIIINAMRSVHMVDRPMLIKTFYHILLGDEKYFLLDYAVTMIQAHYKRKKQRRAFLALKKSTIFIQRRVSYGKSKHRKSLIEKTEEIASVMPFPHAMEIISSSINAMKAHRKQLLANEEARAEAEALERAEAERIAFLKKKEATVAIQRWWRTLLVKEDYTYVKECKVWKGFRARKVFRKMLTEELSLMRSEIFDLWNEMDISLAFRSHFWINFAECNVRNILAHRGEIKRLTEKKMQSPLFVHQNPLPGTTQTRLRSQSQHITQADSVLSLSQSSSNSMALYQPQNLSTSRSQSFSLSSSFSSNFRRHKYYDEEAHKELKREKEQLRKTLKAYLKLGPPPQFRFSKTLTFAPGTPAASQMNATQKSPVNPTQSDMAVESPASAHPDSARRKSLAATDPEAYNMYKCRVYFSWNINPTSKNRKTQLIAKLWRDLETATQSAGLIQAVLASSAH